MTWFEWICIGDAVLAVALLVLIIRLVPKKGGDK